MSDRPPPVFDLKFGRWAVLALLLLPPLALWGLVKYDQITRADPVPPSLSSD